MSIKNATLLTITPPPVPSNADGGEIEGTPVASGARVFLDTPRTSQLMSKINKVKDASDMLYVEVRDSALLVVDCRVSVRLDGMAAKSLKVLWVEPNIMGFVSHVLCYCGGL